MSIEYLGLSSINGPLIALEGVQGAFFDEIVEFVIGGSERKIGRIIELYEDKAVIQVFEGSENMSLKNTHTRLTGHPMEIALSPAEKVVAVEREKADKLREHLAKLEESIAALN